MTAINYSYNCTDKSIVLPFFKKYYVALFFKLVPHKLTANFITLISSGLIFYLLYACHYFHDFHSVIFAAVIAFCLHGYIVGDHLDGMQAKKTDTSSPLGEFLDHYFDIYNGAIIFLVFILYLGNIPSTFFYPLLWLNFLAFGATMVEEVELGELRFGLVGTLEGVILLIFFFLSWTIPSIRDFWRTDLISGYPWYWVIIGIAALAYLGTLIDIIWRLGYTPRQFNLFMVVSGLLSLVLFLSETPVLVGWWALTLFSSDYIGRVLGSYLCHKKHEYPDIPSCIAISLAGILFYGKLITMAQFDTLIFALILYFALKVFISFWQIFADLRIHWSWINAEPLGLKTSKFQS